MSEDATDKFCHNCGAEVPAEWKYCSECGAKREPNRGDDGLFRILAGVTTIYLLLFLYILYGISTGQAAAAQAAGALTIFLQIAGVILLGIDVSRVDEQSTALWVLGAFFLTLVVLPVYLVVRNRIAENPIV